MIFVSVPTVRNSEPRREEPDESEVTILTKALDRSLVAFSTLAPLYYLMRIWVQRNV
jgi:ABC-type oligopeptide transport system substrate-binding subunit